MSKETRIGFLFALAIGIFIAGFKFLKGQNVLSSDNLFYVEYDDVDFLAPANKVLKNGLQVGMVKEIYMKPDDPTKIVVELTIEKSLSIPKNARATIASSGVMGGKVVLLEYEKNCQGSNCAQTGDYLRGATKGLLQSMIGNPSEVNTYVDIIKDGFSDLADSLGNNLKSNSELSKTFADLQATLNNLASTTSRLDRLMARSSGNLEATLGSVASLTKNLEANNNKINGILSNVESLTNNLNDAKLDKTVVNANEALTEVKKVMASANGAVEKLSAVMTKVDGKSGSLGKLINDAELYDNLNKVSKSITLLTSDMREHPERYRRILSKKTKTEPLRTIPEELQKND